MNLENITQAHESSSNLAFCLKLGGKSGDCLWKVILALLQPVINGQMPAIGVIVGELRDMSSIWGRWIMVSGFLPACIYR